MSFIENNVIKVIQNILMKNEINESFSKIEWNHNGNINNVLNFLNQENPDERKDPFILLKYILVKLENFKDLKYDVSFFNYKKV